MFCVTWLAHAIIHGQKGNRLTGRGTSRLQGYRLFVIGLIVGKKISASPRESFFNDQFDQWNSVASVVEKARCSETNETQSSRAESLSCRVLGNVLLCGVKQFHLRLHSFLFFQSKTLLFLLERECCFGHERNHNYQTIQL